MSRTITITSDLPGSVPVKVKVGLIGVGHSFWCCAYDVCDVPHIFRGVGGRIDFSSPETCVAAYAKAMADIEAAREAERREKDDARIVGVPLGVLREWMECASDHKTVALWCAIKRAVDKHESNERRGEGR